MASRLQIGTVLDVGFIEEIGVATTYAISDIREPDKRNGSYVRSVEIPGNPEINRYFENIFEANVDLQTFNPNLKTDASYYVNEILVFRGDVQLKSIEVTKIENVKFVKYKCNIIGELGSLFSAIQGLYLTDLDFSDLNHTHGYAAYSATPTIGTGYCYGYIDYGLGGLNSNTWRTYDFKASIWAKEYIDRIFAAQGKTYTSSFLNGTDFKSLAIPDVNEGPYQLSPTQITNNQFYAGKSTSTSLTTALGTVTLSGWPYTYTGVAPFIFNDDSTPPFNDPGGNYNTGTGYFTTAIPGYYNFTAYFNYTLTFSAPATATSLSGTFYVNCASYGGSTLGPPVYTAITINEPVVAGSVTISGQVLCAFNNVLLPAGDIQGAQLLNGGGTLQWYNGAVPVVAGSSSLTASITSAGFYSTLASYQLPVGQTVDMNSTVPKEVTQMDFLKSIFLMYNLYCEQDKTSPNNYIIEPRNTFIQNTNPLDWTYKQDRSKKIEFYPMGDLDGKNYILTYKEDSDYFNKRYQDSHKEIYGQRKVIVESDFLKQDKRIELIFSPTPCASHINNIVAPRLLSIDGAYPGSGASGNVKPLKCNIRILRWGGIIPCATHTLITDAGNFSATGYPFLGMVDNPANPTIDLGFDAPLEVYWDLPGQTWTNNNLYQFWAQFLGEISNKNSKILKGYFMLNEQDISKFSFRKKIFIDDAYYFVNVIKDFDPQVRKSVYAELLKLQGGLTPTTTDYVPWDPPAGQNKSLITLPSFNSLGNAGQSSALAIGTGVQNFGENSFLLGGNSKVALGVTGFAGIGVTNQIIDTSYSNKTMLRNNGLVVTDDGIAEDKKVRVASNATSIYVSTPITFVDATAGNIDVYLPGINAKGEYVIVRVDNSGNTVNIQGLSGTENLYNGGTGGLSYNLPARTTKRFNSNLSAWYYYG